MIEKWHGTYGTSLMASLSLSYYIPFRLKRQNKNFVMKFPEILTESMLEIVVYFDIKILTHD